MSEENKNVRCDLCGEEISSQNAKMCIRDRAILGSILLYTSNS